MKRTNPITALSANILLLLLFGWIGFTLLVNGSMAFNPGLLTARSLPDRPLLKGFKSHADFENECSRCHQPFISDQATLCLACHETVAAEVNGASGIHTTLTNVRYCRRCHPDHQGREFSPAIAATKYFDHGISGFSLINHQVGYDAAPMECAACHQEILQGDFRISQDTCTICHMQNNFEFMQKHQLTYSTLQCLDCHDGYDRMANFDHAVSEFPLIGKHNGLDCEQCHLGPDNVPQFSGISKTCSTCHAEPDLHKGVFSEPCETCHQETDWKPANLNGQPFDHSVQGRFSLVLHTNQLNANLICLDCHVGNFTNTTEPICHECHARIDAQFLTEHAQRFGLVCLKCHDGVDRYSNFDHNQYFALDGRHAEIDCSDCHGLDTASAVYQGLGKDCVQCHEEPDIHAGSFGVQCQDCHSNTAWSPAFLRSHNFPLGHGEQGELPCETCHIDHYTEYTCYNCHEHSPVQMLEEHTKEGISSIELPACIQCHPTGKKTSEE